MWDEITYVFPNLNVYTIYVWELMNNLILHFILDVITFPC